MPEIMMDHPLRGLPHIETDRLRLRPLEHHDAEAFRALTDEPAITDAVYFLARPFEVADAERLIVGKDDGRDCFWGVWHPDDPALIGTVGTHLTGAREIEVGYWFAIAAQGKGLASEAVTGIISVLLTAYPERRIVAECRLENEASWRLLEKIGFRADGADGARPGRRRLVFRR